MLPGPQTVRCPRENTIFITGEPFSKWHYPPHFLSQFGTVVAFERTIKGKNVIYGQPFEAWSVGRKTISHPDEFKNMMTYDELKAVKEFKKDKLISVFLSSKAFYPGHVKRLEFVSKLARMLDIDVFGKGINPLDDKWDGLSRYKYHVSLENFVSPDYFTGKLTDAFLGGAFPFYFGAPNIFEYFSHDSLIPIDIGNVDDAITKIKRAIDNDVYEKSIMQLQVARNKVLDEYNIFPGTVKLMDKMNADLPKEEVTLIPASRFQSLSVKVEWKIWTKFFLWRTKGKAEKAIYELSKGKTKERKVA